MYQALILKTDNTTIEMLVNSRKDLTDLLGGVFQEISSRILACLNQKNELPINEWFEKNNKETYFLKKNKNDRLDQ